MELRIYAIEMNSPTDALTGRQRLAENCPLDKTD